MLGAYYKHFLDSSVVRPMFHGAEVYKQYFKEHFRNDRLYISNYVQMEFLRSFIVPILGFYFILDLPNVRTISDALSVWSNRFKKTELKALINLVSIIFQAHVLDFTNPKDKEKALRAIDRIIIRYHSKLKRSFLNIGDQGARCERAKVALRQKRGVNDKKIFEGFLDSFLNVTQCQSKCVIEHFLCKRYKSEVEKYIRHAQSLRNPNSTENVGFFKISDKLNQILQKNTTITCRVCEAIGDAIIALEMPQNMLLEHTDYSFDHLCKLIDKPHNRHPSEISVVKRQ